MADSPSQISLPAAQAPLDGTEHIIVSQSGNLRTATLAQIFNKPAALILPTADPHVVGALWNNAGTITISAG